MRSLSLLFLCFCLTGAVHGQSKLNLGLRLSPILSNASISDSSGNEVMDDVSSKLGLTFGLIADYNFTENYALHTGVHIVRKGFRREGPVMINDSSTVVGSQNISITSVEIPLALKLRTPEIGTGWFANGLFGVSADIRTGSRNEWEGVNPLNNNLAQSGTLQSQASFINPLALSFIFGVGGEYEVGGVGRLNFGIVYHRGLTNLNRRRAFQENTQGNSETYRVSYISLELGYYF